MNLLIVEDHVVVREGLVELINRQPDLEVVAQAGTAEEAMNSLRSTQIDVAVVDLALQGLSGIELIRMIKDEFPAIPVLVLSMLDEQFYAERALRAGAHGYVSKLEASEKLMTAIRKVHEGDLFVSEEVARQMLLRMVAGEDDGESAIAGLSERELEVFQLIGQGYGTREIAQMLSLSIKTIESYRANIKQKLSLKNASELVQYAVIWTQQNRP